MTTDLESVAVRLWWQRGRGLGGREGVLVGSRWCLLECSAVQCNTSQQERSSDLPRDAVSECVRAVEAGQSINGDAYADVTEQLLSGDAGPASTLEERLAGQAGRQTCFAHYSWALPITP